MIDILHAPLHHYELCQSKHDKGNKRCCKISVALQYKRTKKSILNEIKDTFKQKILTVYLNLIKVIDNLAQNRDERRRNEKFLLLVALILSFAFDVYAIDATSAVVCKIVSYTHGLGGPMITIVIIGAALLAIFGRMPWPALFALGTFTAVFFGAPVVVSKITSFDAKKCVCEPGKTLKPNKKGDYVCKKS